MSDSERADASRPSVSVAVVGICGARQIERCLDALDRQVGAGPLEIVVACDPHIRGLEPLRERHPRVRWFSNEGQRTPLELASRALRESRGEWICLTEDHCVPEPGWVARLLAAGAPERAAVGGRVEIRAQAPATDWAFYFVDFFRYAAPVRAGAAPSLTVCNVAYPRAHLAAIAPLWQEFFHETAVNDALRARFGPLWLEPSAVVVMDRQVALADALYERYAFGRLFGCTRLLFASRARRLLYLTCAPALPLLLLGRMAAKACSSRRLAREFLRSLGPLTLMVVWWSWGEWLGYLTRRHPRSLVVAPELRAAERAEASGAPRSRGSQ